MILENTLDRKPIKSMKNNVSRIFVLASVALTLVGAMHTVKEGDVFVRIDLSIRVLDKQEMQENIDQVAAAANEVFAGLKPYLITAK